MMVATILLLFLATFGIKSAICDVPRCDESGSHPLEPFCMPNDYNKDLVPPTEGPLQINVDIWVFEVSKIDDIALAMTFELYFDLTWNESRLVMNESSDKWGPDGTVMGSTNFIKSMWLPDIQILNLKQFQKRQIVTDVAGLIIFKNKSVLYTVSTEAIISCPMKFSAYPLDHQVRFTGTLHELSQLSRDTFSQTYLDPFFPRNLLTCACQFLFIFSSKNSFLIRFLRNASSMLAVTFMTQHKFPLLGVLVTTSTIRELNNMKSTLLHWTPLTPQPSGPTETTPSLDSR